MISASGMAKPSHLPNKAFRTVVGDCMTCRPVNWWRVTGIWAARSTRDRIPISGAIRPSDLRRNSLYDDVYAVAAVIGTAPGPRPIGVAYHPSGT